MSSYLYSKILFLPLIQINAFFPLFLQDHVLLLDDEDDDDDDDFAARASQFRDGGMRVVVNILLAILFLITPF